GDRPWLAGGLRVHTTQIRAVRGGRPGNAVLAIPWRGGADRAQPARADLVAVADAPRLADLASGECGDRSGLFALAADVHRPAEPRAEHESAHAAAPGAGHAARLRRRHRPRRRVHVDRWRAGGA